MTKVTMKRPYCAPHGYAKPGTVIEVPDAEAKQLLQGDDNGPYATLCTDPNARVMLRVVDKNKPAEPVVETATVETGETASLSGHRGRRGG